MQKINLKTYRLNCVPPPNSRIWVPTPVLQNVTLSGNRVIEGVIRLKWGHIWVVWVLIWHSSVLDKKRSGTQREETGEEDALWDPCRAEIQMLQLQAQKCQQSPANHQRLGRGKKGLCPMCFRGSLGPCKNLDFRLVASRLGKTIDFCCF